MCSWAVPAMVRLIQTLERRSERTQPYSTLHKGKGKAESIVINELKRDT